MFFKDRKSCKLLGNVIFILIGDEEQKLCYCKPPKQFNEQQKKTYKTLKLKKIKNVSYRLHFNLIERFDSFHLD